MNFKKGKIKIVCTMILILGVISPIISAKSDFGLTKAIIVKNQLMESTIIERREAGLRIHMKDSIVTETVFFINLGNANWKYASDENDSINKEIAAEIIRNTDIMKLTLRSNNRQELAVRITAPNNSTQTAQFIIPLWVELTGGDATVSVDGNATVISDMSPVLFARTGEYKLSITSGEIEDLYGKKAVPDITIEEPYAGVIGRYGTVEMVFKMKNDDWKFGYSTEYTSLLERDIALERGFGSLQGTDIIKVKQEDNGGSIRFRIEGSRLKSEVASGRIKIRNIAVVPQTSYNTIKDLKIDISGSSRIIPEKTLSWSINGGNLKLSYITISNGMFNPSFSPNNTHYNVILENEATSVDIDGIPMYSGTTVLGGGRKELQVGANTICLDVVDQYGYKNTYTIIITRKSTGTNGGSSTSDSSGSSNGSGGKVGGSQVSNPVAVKKAIEKLTTDDKEKVLSVINDRMPYTSLNGKVNVNGISHIVGDKLSKEELQQVIESMELLEQLGINVGITSKSMNLKSKDNAEFIDVDDKHWAHGIIKDAAKAGFVTGFLDGNFRPDEAINVADTFTVLDGVLLLKDITEMNLSRNTVEKYITNKKHWAFANVASVGSKLSEQTLSKISNIKAGDLSRELLAQVLYEITKEKLVESEQTMSFTDIEQSSYKEAIQYCNRVGLLNGTGDNKMLPSKSLTRAELIVVIMKLDKML